MKLVILSVVFTVLMVVEAKDKPPKGKPCKNQNECDDNECCVERFLFKGRCKPLAQEGDKCNDNLQMMGKYVRSCPCDIGLECEAEDTKDLGFATLKFNQRCVAEGSTVVPTVVTPTEAPEETEAPTE